MSRLLLYPVRHKYIPCDHLSRFISCVKNNIIYGRYCYRKCSDVAISTDNINILSICHPTDYDDEKQILSSGLFWKLNVTSEEKRRPIGTSVLVLALINGQIDIAYKLLTHHTRPTLCPGCGKKYFLFNLANSHALTDSHTLILRVLNNLVRKNFNIWIPVYITGYNNYFNFPNTKPVKKSYITNMEHGCAQHYRLTNINDQILNQHPIRLDLPTT